MHSSYAVSRVQILLACICTNSPSRRTAVSKDELTEERLGHTVQQPEKLERQSSASSQHSVSGQSSVAPPVASNSNTVLPSPPVVAQPTAAPLTAASGISVYRPNSAGSSSFVPASQPVIPSAASIFNFPPSSSSSQSASSSLPFSVPPPTRSVSEGWAAVAAGGAAPSHSLAAGVEDSLPSVLSSALSDSPSLTATAPLPPPTWAAVPSSTSAAALLSHAIQTEKDREIDSRELRHPVPPSAQSLLSPSAASDPLATNGSAAPSRGSVIRRPPPGFEKTAGWSSAGQSHSTSPSPSVPSDDSSFFSMFAFPPPVSSTTRSSPAHSFSTSSHHDHSLQQPTFRSIVPSPMSSTGGEVSGSAWDFNAFVEQLRATTSNLQQLPFSAAATESGTEFTAGSQHRDVLQKALYPMNDSNSTVALSASGSAIRQLRPSAVAEPPLYPAPLTAVTQQLSELSAFSSLLAGASSFSSTASSPSLSLPSSDTATLSIGSSATDADDDWSARADRVEGFDVSFAVSSPRAAYRPSGFDDSPPLTALASLRHNLPPPALALGTTTAASTAPALTPVAAVNGPPQQTIRILSTPSETTEVAEQVHEKGDRVDGGRKEAVSGGSHNTARNVRYKKGERERGERRTSNRDTNRRNHTTLTTDANNATSKRAPVLSLSSPQSKHSPTSSDRTNGDETASHAAVPTPTPAAVPPASTSSPILQLKRTPSSAADKQTSPTSTHTCYVPNQPPEQRPAENNSGSSSSNQGNGEAPAPVAAAVIPAALASPKPILSLTPRRGGQLVRNVSDPTPQPSHPVRVQATPSIVDNTTISAASAAGGVDSDRSIVALIGLRPQGRTPMSRPHGSRQPRSGHGGGGGDSSGSGGSSASPVQRYSAFNSPPLVRLSLSKGHSSSLPSSVTDSHAHPANEPPPPLIVPSHSPHIVDRPATLFDTNTPPALGSSQQLGSARHGAGSASSAAGGGSRDRAERQQLRTRDRDRYRVRDEHGEADVQRDGRRVLASLSKR